MVNVQAIVFDFDGVLVDSEPLHLAAYQQVCSSLGVELTPEDYCANYLGYDDEEVFRKLQAAYGWELDEKALQALLAEKTRVFDEVLDRTDVLYPEAEECVQRLAQDFPLGIASGALRHEIEMILRRTRLYEHFRFIVAAGDTPHSKPWPDPYVRAAQLHGISASACVAIEDSRRGIQAAKTAGLKCIGVSTTYPASQLGAADHVIESLGELSSGLVRSLGRSPGFSPARQQP